MNRTFSVPCFHSVVFCFCCVVVFIYHCCFIPPPSFVSNWHAKFLACIVIFRYLTESYKTCNKILSTALLIVFEYSFYFMFYACLFTCIICGMKTSFNILGLGILVLAVCLAFLLFFMIILDICNYKIFIKLLYFGTWVGVILWVGVGIMISFI